MAFMKDREKSELSYPCKSVFKDGAVSPTKKSVTEAWIKLTVRMEGGNVKSLR